MCVLLSDVQKFLYEVLVVCASQVTQESQVLAFKRYNFWWQCNAKKMKATMRNRIRWNEEAWRKNVDHACLCCWALHETRMDPKAAWLWAMLHTGLFVHQLL